MPTPTDDRRDLLTVIAFMKTAPGKEADLHQGMEDPSTFFFSENWESAAQLDAHLETPHLVRSQA